LLLVAVPAFVGLVPRKRKNTVATILVVGDDVSTQQTLLRLFCGEGFAVDVRSDEKGAVAYLSECLPAVLVLDLRFPRSSGIESYLRIRARAPSVPIIIVSHVSDARDKALLLDLGADDYVSKPFSPREFSARVHVALRNAELYRPEDSASFGGVVVDFKKAEATRDGAPVEMTPREFKMLQFLIRNAERVVARAELLRHLCGDSVELESRTIDTQIFNLRHKLEKDPRNPRYILTVKNIGYRFKLEP
jgi:two-component system, OmpR family, alkaline phosphatase synthesis response regulator PhoP